MSKFVWEVIPMEGASIFVETDKDSVLDAASLYKDHYDNFESVYAIRKAAKTEVEIYDEVI